MNIRCMSIRSMQLNFITLMYIIKCFFFIIIWKINVSLTFLFQNSTLSFYHGQNRTTFASHMEEFQASVPTSLGHSFRTRCSCIFLTHPCFNSIYHQFWVYYKTCDLWSLQHKLTSFKFNSECESSMAYSICARDWLYQLCYE